MSGRDVVMVGRRVPSWLIAAATLLWAPPGSAQDRQIAPAGALLILELATSGVSEDDGNALAAEVAEVAARRPELQVLTTRDIADLSSVEKTKALLGCEADSACIARLSEASHARLVLSGSVGKVGRSYVLSLSLVESGHPDAVGRSSESADSLAELRKLVAGLLARVFGWASATPPPSFALPEGRSASFAVLDLEPGGVPDETARSLTQVLSAEINRTKGTTVISRDDILAMLSADKLQQLLGAGCDTSCVAEIGGALGVDHLVVGQVGRLAGTYVISLRLIDPMRILVSHRITESFRGPEEELLRAVRHAGRRLLGVESTEPGALAVTGPIDEAEVFIDSESVGQLPMPPRALASNGRFAVRVIKDGYFDWQSDVFVGPGETTAVWAVLEEEPERW